LSQWIQLFFAALNEISIELCSGFACDLFFNQLASLNRQLFFPFHHLHFDSWKIFQFSKKSFNQMITIYNSKSVILSCLIFFVAYFHHHREVFSTNWLSFPWILFNCKKTQRESELWQSNTMFSATFFLIKPPTNIWTMVMM